MKHQGIMKLYYIAVSLLSGSKKATKRRKLNTKPIQVANNERKQCSPGIAAKEKWWMRRDTHFYYNVYD